jgi:hypothetical protein
MRRLLVTANVVYILPILVIFMMEALRTTGTSVLPMATRLNIPEDGILHSQHRENLKSYIALTGWALNGDVMCFLCSMNWGFISQKTTFVIVTAVKSSSLICYEDGFTFILQLKFVSRRKHRYEPPRLVTVTALIF